jgi:protein-S-isoprenylcysteine O-methyltransferase Ste14
LDASGVTHDAGREQALVPRLGGWLFRNRGYAPLPLLLVPISPSAPLTPTWWIAALVLIVTGEALRIAGVAAAGPETRRRTRAVHRLVTYGAFAWTRNPLYTGNLLAWTGFALLSGDPRFVGVAMVLFAAVYACIVRYEEAVLESIFGETYLAYKRHTPRWLPHPPPRYLPTAGTHRWRAAWRAETSTFANYVGLAALLAAKARFPIL